MNKGLEELKKIEYKWQYGVFTFIPNFEIIEKELKALEIIKEKQANVSALLELDNLQQYNDYCDIVSGCKKLTQEEYDLLKEVLS